MRADQGEEVVKAVLLLYDLDIINRTQKYTILRKAAEKMVKGVKKNASEAGLGRHTDTP